MEIDLKQELVGEWVEELRGTDLLDLESVADSSRLRIDLRADKTASWGYSRPDRPSSVERQAPFPETWEVLADRVLSILIPIPPNPDPEYEMPDWSQERVCYDILAVSMISLALSDRRFDGEFVRVIRRMNNEEYDKHQLNNYKQALSGLQGSIQRGETDA